MEKDDRKEEKLEKGKKKPFLAKTLYDVQRLRLEKMMQNPDKPIIIPERPKERSMADAPDFVRNVMGSSAGAGSGEFHVYRHLRRKEYARQRHITEKARREALDNDYQQKLDDNKQKADDKTAKKRAKRQKKKSALKVKKPKVDEKKTDAKSESSGSENEDSDAEKSEEEVKKSEEEVKK